MEIHQDDQPPQENIQEQGTSSDDQQQQEEAATSPIRSYDCTFCKRGFSNAQALGGHMNIHRKDKAKHKKVANVNNQNQHSINMAKIQASSDPAAAAATQWPNWILPLFVERSPLLIIDKRAASSCPDQKDLLWSSPEEEKLDLELRLGPESYQDSSKSSTGTKKFFRARDH